MLKIIMLQNFINSCLILTAFVLISDFLFFCLWLASDQNPVGDFYLGTISAHIAQFLI